MRSAWALVAAASLVLAACATTPPPKPTASTHRPAPTTPYPGVATAPTPIEPDRPPRHIDTTPLARLAGWSEENHLEMLTAFQAGCGAAREALMRSACQSARALGRVDDAAARAFFEQNFAAEPAGDPPGSEGVLTAYFAPEYEARQAPDAEFSAPVRPKPGRPVEVGPSPADPDDLIAVALSEAQSSAPLKVDLSTADRSTIERSSVDGALAWMRPEDLFFLQIQGSGTLTFPNGRRMKAAYASDNGKPFVPIARPMVNQGLLKNSGASGEAIRAWLASNRGARAQAVMALNPRYVFFVLSLDDGRDPAGAAGVPLPPGRAIAVDPGRHAYGELFWIDASAPILNGAFRTYRRAVVALDTGSAIRGEVRADLYMGRGPAAGLEAGRVRHTLKMTRLVPVQRERGYRLLGSVDRETAAAPGGS